MHDVCVLISFLSLQTWVQTVWAAPWVPCLAVSLLPPRMILMCLLKPGLELCPPQHTPSKDAPFFPPLSVLSGIKLDHKWEVLLAFSYVLMLLQLQSIIFWPAHPSVFLHKWTVIFFHYTPIPDLRLWAIQFVPPCLSRFHFGSRMFNPPPQSRTHIFVQYFSEILVFMTVDFHIDTGPHTPIDE